MRPAFTLLVSIACILALLGLSIAAGADERTTFAFVCWGGAPYLGSISLAYARRWRPDACFAVFVGTVLSGGLATFLYGQDLGPSSSPDPARK